MNAEPDGASVTLAEHARLGELATAWDALLERSRLPSPFMASWWVDSASRGRPTILTCHSGNGTLVGGAALERDRVTLGPLGVERVRSLGQGALAPDHLDILAAPGYRSVVLGAVGTWLRSGNWVVDLDGLSGTCELPWLLHAPTVESHVAPYLSLNSTDPVAELPGRLRSTIKRSAKRLSRDGFEPRLAEPSEAERALDTLFELHDHRWQDRSSWAASDSVLRQSLVAGLRCGGAVIHELGDGSRVIASELELVAGSRVSFYQAGRLTEHDFRGSGSVLKAHVLRWAAAQGMTEFDLLRGDDGYKADWSNARREVRRMRTGFGNVGRPAAVALNTWQSVAPRVSQLAGTIRSGAA